jgi:hypothetical protein
MNPCEVDYGDIRMINELITRSERVVASLYSVSASELAQFSPQSLTPKDLDSRAEFYSSCFEIKMLGRTMG